MEKEFLENISNYIDTLPQYSIDIGVISETTTRKKEKTGLTNAELLFIHENGSPLQNIPARPVLDMTVNYTKQNLFDGAVRKALLSYLNNNFDKEYLEKELKKLGLKMENYARELIYSNDGRLAPNSPSVIKKKGGNHPLFDTGQLARSITSRVIEN